MSLVIELRNASVYQKEKMVLENIALEVEQGEFVYLIGKVGSGKTSFIKTLYAELPFVTGYGKVVGFELHTMKKEQVPFLRRKLGIVFQDFQLLGDRSVRDNLRFVLKATDWKNEEAINTQIHNVLETVGLKQKEFQMPHQLSGGEQQRISIARALLNHPELILADEPTGNLDPETSYGIMELLGEIKKTGCSVLMATHNYHLIKKYDARILRCEDFKIADYQLGT